MGKVIIYNGNESDGNRIAEALKKVIVYTRVSTEKQTLAQQERTVFEWLKAHNLEATHTVSDEGVSGGVSYKDRNLGKEVIPMLGRGDMLIVSEISRLGRSMSDINKLVSEELKPHGVRLVVVQMGLDLNCANMNALDEMILFAFSFAAQLEKELIQERTQSAINVRKEAIKNNGSFISKSGRIVTSFGRPKGVDLSKANEASVRAKKERARNNPNNIAIWGIIGYSGLPTCEELAQMSATLNRQNIKTAKGLEFTPERVRTAYHNMKKYMLNR